MNDSLAGRRALVCGGSQGIGRACALALASRGASVTLVARDEGALARVASELGELGAGDGHRWLSLDLRETRAVGEAMRREVEDGHGCEVVVNNGGGPAAGRLIDAESGSLVDWFAVHVVAAQEIARVMVGVMRERGFGRIVNVISTSVKAPIPGLGVSNTIRGAMANWAKTLAGELGPDGITVNNVLPGFTETGRLESLLSGRAEREGKSLESLREEIMSTIPARRFASPEETAGAVAYLCSAEAGYVNGINLPVDGGRTPTL